MTLHDFWFTYINYTKDLPKEMWSLEDVETLDGPRSVKCLFNGSEGILRLKIDISSLIQCFFVVL